MYYSIKTSNTQGWNLSEAQLPKAPKYLAELVEIEVYFSYLDRIGLLKIVFVQQLIPVFPCVFSLYFVFLLYKFRHFFSLYFYFLLYRFRFFSLNFVFLHYRFRWILFSFRFISQSTSTESENTVAYGNVLCKRIDSNLQILKNNQPDPYGSR